MLPRPAFVNPNRCFLFSEFVKTKSIPCLQNSMVFDVSSDACLVRLMLVWQSRRWVPGYYWLQHKCILATSSDEHVYYNWIHLCFSEPFEEVFIAHSKTDWYGYQDLDRQWWFVGYVCSGFALLKPYCNHLSRFALMLLCALRVLKLVISGIGSVAESFESGEVHANAWNRWGDFLLVCWE